MTIVGETLSFSTKPSGISTSDLDWAELPALNYTHITVGGDYYIDNCATAPVGETLKLALVGGGGGSGGSGGENEEIIPGGEIQ